VNITATDKLAALWRTTIDGKQCIIIDGGLSNELKGLGARFDSDLWTAELIAKKPELIIQAHMNYLNAGARIITTSSYQATTQGLVEAGYSSEAATDILVQSVDIALEARERSECDSLIAASIGPYGAYLADGSEYRGDYSMSIGQLIEFHQPRWDILNRTDADLFALETIPSKAEVFALFALIEQTPERHCWLSLQCKDAQHLADGTPISELLSHLTLPKNLVAIGVNCLAPEHTPALCKLLRKHTDLPIVAYPNLGQCYDAQTKEWSSTEANKISPDLYRELGCFEPILLGGCCEVSSEDIQLISSTLFELTD